MRMFTGKYGSIITDKGIELDVCGWKLQEHEGEITVQLTIHRADRAKAVGDSVQLTLHESKCIRYSGVVARVSVKWPDELHFIERKRFFYDNGEVTNADNPG